jgi:hypothetical protein
VLCVGSGQCDVTSRDKNESSDIDCYLVNVARFDIRRCVIGIL